MASFVRISEAASLALHTMALLAHEPTERYTNRQIAELLGASGHHLAKVMARLVKRGMVRSAVGPSGGFQLAQPAKQITLLDIYETMEGPLGVGECLMNEPVCDGKACVLGEVIQSVHDQVRMYLEQTSLAQLAERVGFIECLEKQVTVHGANAFSVKT